MTKQKTINNALQPVGVRTRHSLVVVKRNSLLIRKNKFFGKSFFKEGYRQANDKQINYHIALSHGQLTEAISG